MGDNFVKVELNDAKKKNIGIRHSKEGNGNIKVIRAKEPDLSSESSYSDSESSSSSGSSNSSVPVKKTKKVLRKKSYAEPKHNYDAFSNPKKISRNEESDTESEYSNMSSENSYDSGSEASDYADKKEKESWEQKQKEKQDLLIKITALQNKGFEFSKKFNMTSNYEEMKFEYEKIKSFIDTQAGIKMARRALMACVTGLEFMNRKFDPFNIKLDGWSENVMESVEDYDNVFERLLEKYSGSGQMAPELELLITLGGSAFMFHISQTFLKSMNIGNVVNTNTSGNGIASVLSAMSQGMKDASRPPNFKANPQTGFPAPVDTRGDRKEMRGPNMDPNLFSGTPIATNHPNQVNTYAKPPPPNYYDEPDDRRFSIASSSDSDFSSISSDSSVSVRPKRRIITKGKNKGIELNL